jgi:hypothetical protein
MRRSERGAVRAANAVIRTTLENRGIDVVGYLHLPPDFDEERSHAALVLATPRQQRQGADRRCVCQQDGRARFRGACIDPSHQGESGGEPPCAPAEPTGSLNRTRWYSDESRCSVHCLSAAAFAHVSRALERDAVPTWRRLLIGALKRAQQCLVSRPAPNVLHFLVGPAALQLEAILRTE